MASAHAAEMVADSEQIHLGEGLQAIRDAVLRLLLIALKRLVTLVLLAALELQHVHTQVIGDKQVYLQLLR
jgi:hypothetical protein